MTQSEIRRLFYGDERKPYTRNPSSIKDKSGARKRFIEALDRRADRDDWERARDAERRLNYGNEVE